MAVEMHYTFSTPERLFHTTVCMFTFTDSYLTEAQLQHQPVSHKFNVLFHQVTVHANQFNWQGLGQELLWTAKGEEVSTFESIHNTLNFIMSICI